MKGPKCALNDKISFCKSIGKPSAGDDTEASSYMQLKAALTAASPVHSTVGTVPSISVNRVAVQFDHIREPYDVEMVRRRFMVMKNF